MEILNAYLRDLLVLHDCVILPGFGGFVGNYKPAKKNQQDYFTPPRKTIAFNPQLKHNDGLIANTISAIEKISYESAMKRIEAFTSNIRRELKAKGFYTIASVGKFQNGTQERILFTPDTTTNFLSLPSGMETFHTMPLTTLPKEQSTKNAERIIAIPALRKVLVAGVSGFALLSLLLNPGNFEHLTLSSLVPTSSLEQTQHFSEEINPTSLEIENTETQTLHEVPLEDNFCATKSYHVIVGCFSLEENAILQEEKLSSKNFSARKFPYNKNLTAVSAGSFETFDQAKILMNKLRKNGHAPAAWILKKALE